MASIAVHGDFLACVTGPNILLYRVGTKEKQIYTIDKPAKPAEKTEKTAEKQTEGAEETAGGDHADSDAILTSAFSPSGRYFVACDDQKNLALWETGKTWTSLSVRQVKRRCLSLSFTHSEDKLVVADKSGDAYSFSVTAPQEDGQLLLGHVSMLLDVAVCGKQGQWVATADRDEKIRVSCLPNAYNVHTFCLGHTEFVTRLLYLREEDLLVSGAGDGTVRLWNCDAGKELCCTSCKDVIEPETINQGQPEGQSEGQGEVQDQGEGEGQDKGQTKDEESKNGKPVHKSDVKRLAFDKLHKLLAVGFDRSPTILVYQLTSAEVSHTLTLTQRIDLSADLWDLTFDPAGNLWVLQGAEAGALSVYRTGGEKLTVLTDVPEADPLETTVQAVNDDWGYFTGALNADSLYSTLHKPPLNPAPKYYERKQRRLAGEGGKRKGADATPSEENQNEGEEEAKKVKVDS